MRYADAVADFRASFASADTFNGSQRPGFQAEQGTPFPPCVVGAAAAETTP